MCPLCSYIRFSAICASAVRAALKPQFKSEALRVAESNVKVLKTKAATACKFAQGCTQPGQITILHENHVFVSLVLGASITFRNIYLCLRRAISKVQSSPVPASCLKTVILSFDIFRLIVEI